MIDDAMGDTIEPASSGRSKCRGCQTLITKGALRFGERIPNPFADDTETTLWFHMSCAAYRRPAEFLAALGACDGAVEDRATLEYEARLGIEHRRLPRIDRAERARSGRAKCRACRDAIAKGAWRVALLWFEDGRFDPMGFVHAECVADYCGTPAVMRRIRHFGTGITDAEWPEFERALRATG